MILTAYVIMISYLWERQVAWLTLTLTAWLFPTLQGPSHAWLRLSITDSSRLLRNVNYFKTEFRYLSGIFPLSRNQRLCVLARL